MRRILFWFAGLIVVLVVAVVIATPWILRAAVPEIFARFAMQASVTGGSLSLLRRELTLEGFVLGAPAAPALSLGELGVGLGLRALIQGRIKLQHIRVKDVSLNAQRLLALQELDDTGSVSARRSLPVELHELVLEDVRLASLGERIGQDVRIVRVEISDVGALLAGRDSHLDLRGAIGGGKVNVQLDVGRDEEKLRAAGTYQVDNAPVRGWARLGSQDADPVSEGVVNGRGDIHIGYAFEARSLEVILDGAVHLAGLGVDSQALKATGGDTEWQGRLAIQWSPQMGMPALRGEGILDVETLQLTLTGASLPSVQAAISDISWHGDFHWRDGFTSEGAVLGTQVEVSGASSAGPGWRSQGEDFSWRLHTQVDADSGEFSARMDNVDLARLSVSVSDAEAPVDIVVESLAVDEIRAAQSADLAFGRATVDTLAVTVTGGWNAVDAATYRIGGLTVKGLSGGFSDKLRAARLSAESLDYAQSARRVRADEIDFAGAEFSLPARLGVAELNVKSLRADEGQGDIWLSGLKATSAHGEAGGRFGAGTIDVTHVFQSRADTLSWEFSGLKLRGLDGDVDDTASAAAIDLGELKVAIGEASWLASGLRSTDVAASLDGDMSVASIGLEKLKHRQPSVGDVQITALDASHFRLRDARAEADGVKIAAMAYRLPDGGAIEAHDLEARGLGGDLSSGLQAEHFAIARGDGRFVGGGRLSAAALATRGLSVAIDGGVAATQATLRRVSHRDAAAATVELDGLDMAALSWAPGGRLSAAKGALGGARFAPADGADWLLAELVTHKFDWDGGARINADSAMLASMSQGQGESPDWRAKGLQATGFQWAIPGDVQAATLSAESVDGAAGTAVWKVASVNATGLRSSGDDGREIDLVESGALAVTDKGNGAAVDIHGAELVAVRVSTLMDLSAGQLHVDNLRLRSDKPDWPSRLTVAELWVTKPMRRFDGVLDLGQVVARTPYLIVAESKDNAWMWPPLPGAASDGSPGEKGDGGARGNGGIRVASVITRGPGRIAFIDRATDPVLQLSLDPVVIAIENVDTRLPGNPLRFRARGTGTRFAGLSVDGELTKRVQGFDSKAQVFVKGLYLPVMNPYIAQHEAMAVTTGRVDIIGDIRIEDDELTGQMEVLLSGLEVESTTGSQVLQRFDPTSFPIRTALAMLADRQGNISVTVPLEARTDDPQFDLVDEVREDFVHTLTTAGQVAANLPGKTLDKTGRLFEKTISLLPGVNTNRYFPVEFAYGADDFTAKPLVYLDQLGKHMGDREALELAFCGRAVAGDSETIDGQSSGIAALFAEASEGVYPTYAPGRDGLLALAEARADLVRHYLRDTHGIPEGRLATCEAQIDAADGAKPRVDLQVKTPAKSKGIFGLFP